MPKPRKKSRRPRQRPTASLAETAYRALLDRLLRKQLVPGMVINRRGVAAELGMSVAPVLEAMVALQAEGFLEPVPRQGTRVRLVHLEGVRGQLLLREALECEAARLYAGPPVRQADGLDALAAAADASERTRSLMDLWQAEFAFHRALVALAGSPPFTAAYEKTMQRKLFVSAQLFLSGEAFLGGNHVALLRDLRTADADGAERLVRAHLRSKKERLFEPLTD